APVCAACGIYVPKMSGRGLGHTGCTIDKLMAIPGFRTDIPHEQFIGTVKKAGYAIISQSGELVPADKKIYALRDATATVDSIPLICSSIMSKKIATGADGMVLDVKSGSGAFMKTDESAAQLASAMSALAEQIGRPCITVRTDMDRPLGRCVGNALEVKEAIDVLRGERVPDLYELSIELAADMLMLADCGSRERCLQLAEDAISSGAAFERFELVTQLQGGDVSALKDTDKLGVARYKECFTASGSGYISAVDAEKTGLAALSLGAGRKTKEDTIDITAGIVFRHSVGDYVTKGETIAELYSSVSADMSEAAARLSSAVMYSSEKPVVPPVIR
ncbi:MAG: thymidine phosphorylase, partial [Oscillospiraceae bacterium]|nr:thymidine phosphorylase [Oscillospiraceae bacterium]